MDKKQTIGYAGTLLLALGVFMPIISVPFLGNVNYFQNGKGDGTVLLIVAVITAILIWRNLYNLVLVAGIISLGLLGYTFYNFNQKMSEVQTQMNQSLTNNPFRGIADAMVGRVQMEYGWIVLVIGSVLLIVSAAIAEVEQKQRKAAKGRAIASQAVRTLSR